MRALAEKGAIVSNRVRAAAWAAMIAVLVAVHIVIDPRLGVRVPCLPCRVAGLALLAVVLRAAAVTGRYLAVYGKPRGGRFGEIGRLVREGPYGCMRHPMHLFLSMFPLSVALLLCSPAAIAAAIVEMILILLMAVKVDERESLARFGEEYERYRREVPAFNLSPRCLWLALARRPPKRR